MDKAESPKYDNVEVRALSRMFVGGRMVGPGEKGGATFRFTGDELPGNTALAAEPEPAVKAKPLNGDTKPADAKAAVKAKAAGASGSDLA
jgi:hypothetical protein